MLVLGGWKAGMPLPPIGDGRVWSSVHAVARRLHIHTTTIHRWATRHEIGSRAGRSATGQAERLVNLEEVRARAGRANPARFTHRRRTHERKPA